MAYCWRCKTEVPMFDEQEWEQVLPRLLQSVERMNAYRDVHGASLVEAKDQVWGAGAAQRYYELTGFQVSDPSVIWHHRLSDFGPPCSSCGNLLRTPRAAFCAACGMQVG